MAQHNNGPPGITRGAVVAFIEVLAVQIGGAFIAHLVLFRLIGLAIPSVCWLDWLTSPVVIRETLILTAGRCWPVPERKLPSAAGSGA